MKKELKDFSSYFVQNIGSKKGPISPCIVNSASFSYEDSNTAEGIFEGSIKNSLYSRMGNPTTKRLETILAGMDKGVGAVVTSSGMAAISLACMSLLNASDEVICIGGLFGGTYSFFKETMFRFGIKTHFLNASQTKDIESLINEKSKIIYFESIGNPNMRIVEIDNIVQIAKKYNIATIIDNTSTPLTLQPLGMGIDIAIYSTTKIISGNSSALGGVAVFRGINKKDDKFKSDKFKDIHKFIKNKGEIALVVNARKRALRDFGMSASAFNSYLTLLGLETLAIRTNFIANSTKKIVKALSKAGMKVNHPLLKNHSDNKLYKKYFKNGCGTVFTIDFGVKKRAYEFINNLKFAFVTANISDSRTLALHMDSTIFNDFSKDEKEFLGIGKGLVRISVGLENPDDIIADFLHSYTAFSTS